MKSKRQDSRPVRLLSATGMLGTGYDERTLQRGLDMGLDGIGCDAGTSDSGPYFLGSGTLSRSRKALKRDLRLIMVGTKQAGIPLVIGSAIAAGADPQLAEAVRIVHEIAEEEGYSPKLAVIHGEVDRDWFMQSWQDARVRPMPGVPDLREGTIEETVRLVAQMGAEPYLKALKHGAEIILAGRSSDAAIFSALAMWKGVSPGPAWHAGKILECGAAAAVRRLYPDCIVASYQGDSFTIDIPNPDMSCSVLSVRAHGYYENPYATRVEEPGGTIDMSKCVYHELHGGAVRVEGSQFRASAPYRVRVEGCRLAGYRSIVFGGISDPILLDNLDNFLETCQARIYEKVETSLGARFPDDYRLILRRYGSPLSNEVDSSMTHRVGILYEAIASTQSLARAIAAIAFHTALHHPVAGWQGLVSNLAIPFSPSVMNCGEVYEWTINHLVELRSPTELFRTIGPHRIGKDTVDAAW